MRGQEIDIHSWIYRLDCGRITPLTNAVHGPLQQYDGRPLPAAEKFPISDVE